MRLVSSQGDFLYIIANQESSRFEDSFRFMGEWRDQQMRRAH
jgi:hypothetical protein